MYFIMFYNVIIEIDWYERIDIDILNIIGEILCLSLLIFKYIDIIWMYIFGYINKNNCLLVNKYGKIYFLKPWLMIVELIWRLISEYLLRDMFKCRSVLILRIVVFNINIFWNYYGRKCPEWIGSHHETI